MAARRASQNPAASVRPALGNESIPAGGAAPKRFNTPRKIHPGLRDQSQHSSIAPLDFPVLRTGIAEIPVSHKQVPLPYAVDG